MRRSAYDKPTTFLCYKLSHAHFCRNDNGAANCHCFRRGDAEVLEKRRKHKYGRRSKQRPFSMTVNRSNEANALGHSLRLRQPFQGRLILLIIVSSDHQIDVSHLGHGRN